MLKSLQFCSSEGKINIMMLLNSINSNLLGTLNCETVNNFHTVQDAQLDQVAAELERDYCLCFPVPPPRLEFCHSYIHRNKSVVTV